MSRNHLFVLTVAILALGITLDITPSITTTRAQGPMPQATAEHKSLEYYVGTWDADSKFWMAPGTEPMTGKAVETNKLLGTMWMVSEFKGEVMGMPFTGLGQYGYDLQKKKYVGTWIDTMSPYLSVMKGTMDKSTKTLTMMSKGFDPMLGKESISKMVSTMIDHDHKKFQIFMPVKGKEGEWWKQMEIEYTRRKIVDVDLEETDSQNRPPKGHMELQDHGQPLEFHNVRIKRLDGTASNDTQSESPLPAHFFEQRIYTTAPGKLPNLNQRFRDHTNYLFVKHGMHLVGYWTPVDKSDTLVYILAYPSREAREASWAAFVADPEWKRVYAESHEKAGGKIVVHVDSTFMVPTDYSPMR